MTSIIKFLGTFGTEKDTGVRMWLYLLRIKSIERSHMTAASMRYSEEMQKSDLIYIPYSLSARLPLRDTCLKFVTSLTGLVKIFLEPTQLLCFLSRHFL